MAGVWKKTMTYLGLVEEDDFEQIDDGSDAEAAPVRRIQRPQAVRELAAEPQEGVVRTIPSPRPPPPARSTNPSRAGSTRRATSRIASRTARPSS